MPKSVHAESFAWNSKACLYGLASPLTPAAVSSQIDGRIYQFAENGDSPPILSDATAPEAIVGAFALVAIGRAFCISGAERIGRWPTQGRDVAEHNRLKQASVLTESAKVDPTFQTVSSGTTGAPRVIKRTHRSWIKSFEQNTTLWGIGDLDRTAVLGRLGHSLALYASFEALHLGADLHLLAGGRPDRQFVQLKNRRITILYATPAQLKLLDEARRRLPEGPATTLRLVLVGGAKLDPATRAAIREMFPAAEVHEFYGASETSFITIADRDTPDDSVGRAYPEAEIEIRNDQGTALGPGSMGEIWVRSPYLFLGYATGAAGDTRWDGDFLTIGEVGRLDPSGFLYLSGRKSRMTTIADQNVFLEEVESALLGQDGIEQATALAVPDRKRGSVLVAFVRLGQRAPAIDQIAIACRATVGSLKAPRSIIPLDRWPLLPSGKTDLAALREHLDSTSS